MSSQIEKYEIKEHVGQSIMRVVHKYDLKSYTMKVI